MVPAEDLVKHLAEYLKENVPKVKPPPWSLHVKTGVGRERPPQDLDWWYVRCASILRKLYLHGPVGVERLRAAYGGRKRPGQKGREHFKKGGGAIIREALHQLESAGLVVKEGSKGRKLSPLGISLLDRISMKLLKSLQKEIPKLKKYA